MNSFKIIKNSFLRLKHYFSDYFVSMVVLQGIRILLILPMLSYLFTKILDEAGVYNITNKNFFRLFENPISILLIIALLILSILFIFYELGYYFVLADAQVKNEFYTFKDILRKLNKKAKYFLSIYSFLFIGYFLLLLPIVSIGLGSELTDWIKIPNFIVDEMLLNKLGKFIYFVLVLALVYLAFRLIYTMYFFIRTSDKNILNSMKESMEFSKDKTFKNGILILITTVIYGLIMSLFLFICIIPVLLTDKYAPIISPITSGISLTLMQIVILLLGGLIQPLIVNVIVESTGFTEKTHEYPLREPISIKKILEKIKGAKKIIIVVLLIFMGFNTFSLLTVVYQPETLVIAHRGNTTNAAENTIRALKEAANVHADAVEMDIQETKDGKFVVMHDFNLKRLTGKNKKVRNLTLEELQKLTIKQRGYEEKIPSLSEYIDVAKRRNIKILIEVKPHGYESDEMEENLVKLLKKKKVDKHFMVQSLDLEVLDKIKSIDPEIETGYIIPLNFGSLPETNHDFLVLEDFSISKNIIEDAKKRDIKLFAWTINEDDLMQKYFRLNIDAIITNYPERAIEIRENKEYTKTFINRVRFLLQR